MNIAIVGATGNVGRKLLEVIEILAKNSTNLKLMVNPKLNPWFFYYQFLVQKEFFYPNTLF